MNNTKIKILVAGMVAFVGGAFVCLAITTLAVHRASVSPQAQAQAQGQPHWTNGELIEGGYGTPEAALKTLLWSINSGDEDTFLGSFSPDHSAKIQKAWGDKLDTILRTFRRGLEKTTDFQIVSEQSADDETTIDLLSTLGDGRAYDRKFTFKKFGNDWKCDHVFPIPHVE